MLARPPQHKVWGKAVPLQGRWFKTPAVAP